MGADVRALFQDAPLISAAPLDEPPGSVRFGTRVLPVGARVVLLGAPDDVRAALDAVTGVSGPAPAVAAVAGSVVTVSRGEPELDGTIAANVTLWGRPDPVRYAEAVTRTGLAVPERELATGQRRLSDGEAVRLALARAWYQAPDVLILDDSLSALDPPAAASVAAGLFGPESGPTRIYAGTRTDPATWATHVVLCGPVPRIVEPAAVTEADLIATLPPAEVARWRTALGAGPAPPCLPIGGGPAEPSSAPLPWSAAVLAEAGVEADVAAPRLRDAAAQLAGLFSRPALGLLAVVVGALVIVDLATAGALGRPEVSLPAVAGLAVAGAVLTGLHRVVVLLGALPATRALHQQILGRILRRGLPAGSATVAGRFTEDFTTVELWSPGILVGGVQATFAAVVSVAAITLATPVVLVGVVLLGLLATVGYPRLRRDSVRGRALLAATRGPVRTYGGAVLGCRSFTLSSGLRPGFSRRYRDLIAVEHVAIYAAHSTRMAIIGAVEVAGAALFACTVAAAALAPTGLAGLIAVAVYASYAIGERFATLVEAHQEVDGTAQVLARVSDLLTARTLPRQRVTRRGPATAPEVMTWLTGGGRPVGDSRGDAAPLVAERAVAGLPGRAGTPVDLVLERGRLAVVRGGSGAGKSVFLRTLAGLEPLVAGGVLIGGRAPAPYDGAGRAALRLVENDPPPLPLPVRELCGPGATGLAEQWCRELGLAPVDPQAQIGSLGAAQRQVVALAVACAADPAVLLVDETTSAFDPAGERTMLTLIRDRLPDAAIVAVLHRPDNIGLADIEIVIEQKPG